MSIAEIGFDERFALVAQFEGEELLAFIERFKENPVARPHLFPEELGLGEPNELALVAIALQFALITRAGK